MSVFVCVCLFVCLRVRLYLSLSRELYVPSLPKFSFMLPVAVAQSSFGVIAIRYVLPVLWTTSYFLYSRLVVCWRFDVQSDKKFNRCAVKVTFFSRCFVIYSLFYAHAKRVH